MRIWKLALLISVAIGAVVGAWWWLLTGPPSRPQVIDGTQQTPAPVHQDDLKGQDFGGEYLARVPASRLAGLQWLRKAEGPGSQGLILTAECASLQLDAHDVPWLDIYRLRQNDDCLGMFALGRGAIPESEHVRKLHACGVVQGRAFVLFSTRNNTWLGWSKQHPLRNDLTMQEVEVWKNVPCNHVTAASVREVRRGAALELKMGKWTLTACVVMKGGAVLGVEDVSDPR
jgi:hypothetical protein